MNIFANPLLSAVNDLLARASLPASDLEQCKLSSFFGCESESKLIGLVGLELFDSVALLRSLAVDVSRQRSGLGKMLVFHAEDFARSAGVETVYLLTTSAESFFERLGYSSVSRDCAPGEICATTQYSELCPVDSAFMMKCLL
jgi:N-acetylglutamate synthase-like GNAT family acetyltransferase